MFQEVRQESFAFVDFLRCVLDLRDDLFGIFRSEVCHFNIFDLIPALLDDVQLRRVGRQSLEVEPGRMFTLVLRLQTFVTLKVVPDNNDGASKMFVQFIEHIRHLGGLRTAAKGRGEQLHVVTDRRERNESDGRKMCPFFRLDDDVGHFDRRPTSQEKRNQ